MRDAESQLLLTDPRRRGVPPRRGPSSRQEVRGLGG